MGNPVLRLSTLVLAIACVGAMAGCGPLPWERPARPSTATAKAPPQKLAPAEVPPPKSPPELPPELPPESPPESPPPKPAPPAAEAEPPAAEPAPAAFDPESLIGADRAKVWSALGTPSSVREPSPSTVWVYGDSTCGLDVFFFLDVNNDELRVLTYELKLADQSDGARNACLNKLANKNSA